MKRIAFLACPGTLPGSPSRRYDAFEHDRQIAALREGLGDRAEVVDIDWRAPLAQLAGFDLALLGTAWDYWDARDEFLARLDALAATGVRVCNSTEMVRWNSDKRYLADLAARGAVTIPTLWYETPGEAEVRAAFDHFGCERVVVKRQVGASAEGQESFTRGDLALAGWAMDRPGMIQPFQQAIQSEGELSFVMIDGRFGHGILKRAQAGDYRIQSIYGGTEIAIEPAPADRAAAEAAMALLPFAEPPLYARIDMLRLGDGRLALIEAELIEPYLYPLQGPEFGKMLADAVLARI